MVSQGEEHVHLGHRLDILGRKKRVRAVGQRGAERQTHLHRLIPHCPSPGFTNRRAACLSGLQGTLDDHLESPPYSCSLPQWFLGHITSVWGPPLHFPNFVPEILNLLESRVFRYHMRSTLPTSCGCCEINGCNRHIFLLLEKSMSFAVLLITVMSNYSG